jgi:hypothetical protein
VNNVRWTVFISSVTGVVDYENLSGKLEWFMHQFVSVLTRKEFKSSFISVLFTDGLQF